MPEPARSSLHEVAPFVTYGWGMIPATGVIGGTTFTTALFPREGGYMIPIKVAVQRAEQLDVGDTVTIRLRIDAPDR